MNKNLKNYLDKIEHLEYKKRLQIHSSLFENKAMISKFLWDIHSYNAKKFYKSKNNQCSSNLEIKGFITGKLSNTQTDLLRQIFKSWKKCSWILSILILTMFMNLEKSSRRYGKNKQLL